MGILVFGEVLIDLIGVEEGGLDKVKGFYKFPGGAPANVAVAISSIKPFTSYLISKVGNDKFGKFLVNELEKRKVNVDYVFFDNNYHTGIAFVELKKAKPNFIIYPDVAYNNLTINDVKDIDIEKHSLFHCGSLTLKYNNPKEAQFFLLKNFKQLNKIISFDVNIRMDFWKDFKELEILKEALKFVNILKLGLEELEIILKMHNEHDINFSNINFSNFSNIDINLIEKACKKLKDMYNIELILLTLGEKGSIAIGYDLVVAKPYKMRKVIDTTGAGDVFMGTILASIYSETNGNPQSFRNLLLNNGLSKILDFANFVSALSITKKGAWNIPKNPKSIYLKKYPKKEGNK